MSEITCTKYRFLGKGALVANVNILVPKWGLEINDLTIWSKEGRKWVSFPSRQYEKDGEKKYAPYLRFEKKEHMDAFAKKVMDAADKWCSENQAQDMSQQPMNDHSKDEEVDWF